MPRQLKAYIFCVPVLILICFSNKLQAQKITTFQTQTGFFAKPGGHSSEAIVPQDPISILQLKDKGFLCLGISQFWDKKGNDSAVGAVVFRLDSLGRTLWTKRFIYTDGYIICPPMVQISDSTFAFAGYYHGSVDNSISLLKIDLNGKVLWSRSYQNVTKNYEVDFHPSALIRTPDGGFLIGGIADKYSLIGSMRDYGGVALLKTNDTGGIVWSLIYDLGFSNVTFELNLNRILNEPDGGFLLNGTVSNGVYPWKGTFLLRIDINGNPFFYKSYGYYYNIGSPGESDMVLTSKAIYIASTAPSSSDTLNIIKINNSGNLVWSKGYKGAAGLFYNLLYDSTKNELLLATGKTIGGTSSLQYAYVTRIDTAGNIINGNLYPNAYTDLGGFNGTANFKQIPNGYVMQYVTPGTGFYIIKTDTGGNTNHCYAQSFKPTQTVVNIDTLPYPKVDTTKYDIATSTFKTSSVPIVTTDSVFCDPFVSWFVWRDSCYKQTTQFYDSTYIGSIGWTWNFGDASSGSANISYLKNPTHTFKAAGTYHVKLTVVNALNNIDSVTRIVHILAPPKSFTLDTTICGGDSVNLSAASTGAHYSWTNKTLLGDSTKQSVWAYPYKNTSFTALVTEMPGCTGTDNFNVTINKNCSTGSFISGIINKYASVTGSDTCLNALIVDTASFFKSGDNALMIQMKGAMIDTSNTSSFGTIKNINNTGGYEYNTVDSVNGNMVFLKYRLSNKYDYSLPVQLVTIPQYSNAVITGPLKAQSWNGTKGGILIFNASGTVINGSSINVSGQGFQGGTTSTGGTTCHKNDYYYNKTSLFGANKGEGIFANNSSFSRGLGANANGGGGGDSYLAGGGGGSNAGFGGNGGIESGICTGTIGNFGLGGMSLDSFYKKNKIFPGGGGGVGFSHNSSATNGANGGGIVIINASKMASDGNSIFANGNSQNIRAAVDGSGGGGGGGSVLLNVNYLAMTAPVLVNGGNGGNDSSASCVGPGGGGGGGVLLLPSNNLKSRIIFSATGGLAGKTLGALAPCVGSNYGAISGTGGIIFTGIKIQQGDSVFQLPNATINSATIIDSGHVELNFSRSVNPNATACKIYRKTNNGAFIYLATIWHPASSLIVYNDAIKTSKDTFSYRISTLDTCGDVSNYSSTHTTIHLKDTIKGCEQAIYLSWNPYVGWAVKQYGIYRSTNGSIENLIANVPGNVTNFKDSSVNYHNQYCYRVLAINTSKKDSSWSEKKCGKTYLLDTAKIITVTKITSSLTNGTVVIRWQNIVRQKYMSGTELYYSSDGRKYSLLATLPPAQDSFVQTGLNTKSADGYYYIKNIDSCGTLSDSSVVNKTMTLTVNVGELLHKLNWTPYHGFKIKEYKIERFQSSRFGIVDSVPGTDTSSREFPAPCNYNIFYRIEADGYNPGELSWSDTMGRKAIDTIPPNAAKITSLNVLNKNNIQLNFISSDSPAVYQYVIQRAVNGTWGTASDFKTYKHGAASSYTDTINTITHQLCYTILTLDSCLNAAQSDTICTETLNSIGLSCRAQVTLALPKIITPPSEPDSFEIYKSTDAVNYNKISQLPITDLTDLDTDVTAGTKYYYKLGTVYNKAGMISYSDTISVIPKTIPLADSAQIVYATVLKSDEIKGQIYVQWKRAFRNDTNARGYYVYSFNTANGKYALLHDNSLYPFLARAVRWMVRW